ncbi:acyltransferase family protein [Alloiococcus sp. CFN-8]|uniref:acyltransferase family protein n=1 Tax=Alloiococcus sp. CFN-8 TaxID=3416081 RepID=UPI003CF6C28F
MNNALRSRREPYFDNLKGVLIILVVLAHFLGKGNVKESVMLQSTILFIYSFHMPLFAFVSGYFSKNVHKSKKSALEDLLIIYVIAEASWAIFNLVVYGDDYYIRNIFMPGYSLWYVVALFLWRVTLKSFIKIKGAILISALLSALIMLISSPSEIILGLERVVGFHIYFLLGYYCNENAIERIKKIKASLAFAILALMFVATYVFLSFGILDFTLSKEVMMHQLSIQSFPSIALGLSVYLLAIPLALGIGVLILAVVSESESFISSIGRDTLPLYLSHTYVVKLTGSLNSYFGGSSLPFEVSFLILLSAATILMFSSRSYRAGFYKFINNLKGISWEMGFKRLLKS